MIDRILEFSIRRRWLVIAAGLILAAWGLVAALRAPVDAIPDLSENQVIVSALWPGHSPREMDDQVTHPISLAVQGVPGVRVVRASSDMGYAWLAVILDDGAAVEPVRRSLAERIAEMSDTLPPGVTTRLAPDSAATGQIFWYTVEGGGLDPGRLRALHDFVIRPQLASVPGVAEVASVGGMPIEYQVNMDPIRLRAKGVTAQAVIQAVASAGGQSGAGVLHRARGETIVRAAAPLGDPDRFDPAGVVRDLEQAPVIRTEGGVIPLRDVTEIALGPGPRRGALEKDGAEAVGGVVLMTRGENPREITRRLKDRIRSITPGLPPGVAIIPFYDRTPLIDGAIRTVTTTIVEAMATATICVLLVLLHLRAAFVIAVTLPLAALASFALLGILRSTGIADVPTNVMSLAGIAISIGVLVDSSIVLVENAMHALRERFGDRPVRGDIRPIVLAASRGMGRPIVFSVAIMLLSFLPVFALGGIEGKMFRPLALTKCFALAAVAALAVTLVPVLCTLLLRGRIRGEMDSSIVRGIIEVYRPVLSYSLRHPAPLAWVLAVTFILGFEPIGMPRLSRGALLVGLIGFAAAARTTRGRLLGASALVVVALIADATITPLGREFLTPLDEGMVMDMPISVPGMSISEAADNLKARDMLLCRFPEVDMVVGKAGRAETPTDPAPPDMIETMVNFRPRDLWPRRKLDRDDARDRITATLDAMLARTMIRLPDAGTLPRAALLDEITEAVMPRLDAQLREYAYQRNRELERSLAVPPARLALDGPDAAYRSAWSRHVRQLDGELVERAAGTLARLAIEEILNRCEITTPGLAEYRAEVRRLRAEPEQPAHHHTGTGGAGHAMSRTAERPASLAPQPVLDELTDTLSRTFVRGLMLRPVERAELIGFGGELDRAVPMPGWTNVWTMPIQNRVDMLSTGVNTTIGVRVLGRTLDDAVSASEAIAAALKTIPGAADVVADPIRGKGYLEVHMDRDQAAFHGTSAAELNDAVATAVGGSIVATVAQGRERHPIRVRYGRAWRSDEAVIRHILVPSHREPGPPRPIPLESVADVRVVEGPAIVKTENGFLCNYVRLNVRNRPSSEFVEEARRVVARDVKLPEGVSVEWTGQFEHELRAKRTLRILMPTVLALIFLVLWATFGDLADALLMMLAVPGAVAGGVFFQWLLGYSFSVTVWVGYIALFGMATSTGIIMLVYLRQAVDRAGGLDSLSPEGLHRAVLDGATYRLRPKLLTEGTTVLGLAPMLWATGVGAEVIRPMAAPVLGGILVADEVIDLFLPVAFFWIRRWRLARLAPPPGVSTDPATDQPPHVEMAATKLD